MATGKGEEGSARCRADGLRHVEIGEAHPFRGHSIEVRRSERRGAVGSDVTVALVVGEDDHHVWWRRHRGVTGKKQEKE